MQQSLINSHATHIIIFHDKSKKFINQKAYNQLWTNISNGIDKIMIGSNMFHFNSISKILSLEEYYVQYPSERPIQSQKTVEEIEREKGVGLFGIVNEFKDNRFALKGMIKGITKYIDGHPDKCENAKELRKQMILKLEQREKVK